MNVVVIGSEFSLKLSLGIEQSRSFELNLDQQPCRIQSQCQVLPQKDVKDFVRARLATKTPQQNVTKDSSRQLKGLVDSCRQ